MKFALSGVGSGSPARPDVLAQVARLDWSRTCSPMLIRATLCRGWCAPPDGLCPGLHAEVALRYGAISTAAALCQ
jgi:hypothetical protein